MNKNDELGNEEDLNKNEILITTTKNSVSQSTKIPINDFPEENVEESNIPMEKTVNHIKIPKINGRKRFVPKSLNQFHKKPLRKLPLTFSSSSSSSSDELRTVNATYNLMDYNSDSESTEIPFLNEKPTPEVDFNPPSKKISKLSLSDSSDKESSNKTEDSPEYEKENQNSINDTENNKENRAEEEEEEGNVTNQESENDESHESEPSKNSEEKSLSANASDASQSSSSLIHEHSNFEKGVTDPGEIERLQGFIRRLRGYKIPEDLIPYKLESYSKISWHGKKIRFTLFRGDSPILYAKLKNKTNLVNISKIIEKKAPVIAQILIGSNFTTFSLRRGVQKLSEIMNVRYTTPKIDYAPRIVDLFFCDPPEGIPINLCNRKPKFTAGSTWILNINGRIAKRSTKNCILTDENDREIMSVMKIKDSELTIEANPTIGELSVFALGISSFLCKI